MMELSFSDTPVERPYTGRYVGIEGPDTAGKTTQLALATAYAEQEGIPTLFIREPGGTDFGNEMRNLILHDTRHSFGPETEYALFLADRSHLISTKILPALQDGMTVITDRRIESSLAYQAASGAFPAEKIWEIGRLLHPAWYMQPDALAILSLKKDIWRQRMAQKLENTGHDKIESRVQDSEKVFDAYTELNSVLPYATSVNANQAPEAVFNDLRPILFGPEHR